MCMSCGRTNCRCTGNGRPQLLQFSEFKNTGNRIGFYGWKPIEFYYKHLTDSQRTEIQRRIDDGSSTKIIVQAIGNYLWKQHDRLSNSQIYVAANMANNKVFTRLKPYAHVMPSTDWAKYLYVATGLGQSAQTGIDLWNEYKDKAYHTAPVVTPPATPVTPAPAPSDPNKTPIFPNNPIYQVENFKKGVTKIWPFVSQNIRSKMQKWMNEASASNNDIYWNLVESALSSNENRPLTDYYYNRSKKTAQDAYNYIKANWSKTTRAEKKNAIAGASGISYPKDKLIEAYNSLHERIKPKWSFNTNSGIKGGARLQVEAAVPFMDTATLNYVNSTGPQGQLNAALETLIRAERPDLIRDSWADMSKIAKGLKWYQAEIIPLTFRRYKLDEYPARLQLFNKYGRWMNSNSYNQVPANKRTTLAGIYPYSRPLKTMPTEYDYKIGPTGNRIWPQSNAKPYTTYPPPLGINKGNSGYPSGPMPDPVAPVTPEPTKPEPAKPKPEPVTPPVVTPEPTPEPTPVVGPKLPSCAEVERVYKAEKDKWWIKWSELVTLGGEKHYNFFLGILAEFTNILNATFDHSHVKCTRNTVTF